MADKIVAALVEVKGKRSNYDSGDLAREDITTQQGGTRDGHGGI